MQADFFEIDLQENDRILLCTDGLTNMVEDDDIRRILNDSCDLKTKVRTLVDTANANGGKDNITVVVIEPYSDEEM